jgi:hypothetical protein
MFHQGGAADLDHGSLIGSASFADARSSFPAFVPECENSETSGHGCPFQLGLVRTGQTGSEAAHWPEV